MRTASTTARLPDDRERDGATSRKAFAGWHVLAVAVLAVFLSGPAQTYGVSVFIDPMLAETGWSRSLVSTAYSIATLISAGGLLLAGRQIDRLGHRTVLAGAAVGFGAALLVVSVINHPATLLLGFALLRTFGSGTLTLAARTLIPQWFVRRRGFAFSLLGFGTALSLAAVPAVSEALIGWVGWRSAWRIDALVMWLVLVPAVILFVRDRPEDMGQHPDGRSPDPVPDGAAEPAEEVAWTLRQAARTRPFWYLLSAGVVPSLVVTGLSFNQVSIFTSRGMSSTLAATTFSVESAVALPTSLLCGWLVDRYPSRYVLAASQLSLAVAMLWLLVADSVGIALLYAVFRGASSGLWNVAADVTWPTYFGRRYLGSIRSVTFAVGIAGAAIGPLPFGIVYDALGSYDYAIAGLLALPALSTIAAVRAAPPRLSPDPAVA